MKKIIYIIAVLITYFNFNAYSQNDNAVIKNAVTGLKTLSGDRIIEKAYLHFDKPYYAAGDTMYFKAYVTLGEHHDLSKASGVLYADLVAPDNTIANSIRLQLVNGVAWGDFALPVTSQKGSYRVRAYTRYMQNDPAYFFDQSIPVGSIVSNAVPENSTATAQTGKADLQFFPEGGELLNGMISKVAFKAVGNNGLGVNVKGVVVDNTNAQVGTFASSHLGMGILYLEAEAGKTYKAKVTFADGSQGTFDLPAPAAKGIALSVKDTLDKISIEVHCDKAYFQENMNKDISLVIYSGGYVNTVGTKLDSRRLSMDIPNSQFPSGVLKITLFSQTGEPLSERLLFIQNPDMVNLAVSSNKTAYHTREKVSINVNAKDKGANVTGHFSVSVIDESKVPVNEDKETTILTQLLLTSELKGYVEQPNYYFAHNDAAALDVLMLTQGYRRFTWQQLLGNDAKFTYAPEKTFEISGNEKTSYGEALSKKDIILRGDKVLLTQQTDENGKFRFDNLAFADKTIFTLQSVGSSKNKNAPLITIDNEQPFPFLTASNLPGTKDDINQMMLAYLENNKKQRDDAYKYDVNKEVHLNSVTIADSNKAAYSSSNIGGSGHADQVVTSKDLKDFSTLSGALDGRLHGVTFYNGVAYLNSSRGFTNGKVSNDPVLLIVDGATFADMIDNINPNDVETVELLKGANAGIYGMKGGAGVLVITTRQGNRAFKSEKSGLGVLQFSPKGFYKARQFYAPRYENTIANSRTDFRSTIAWVPELVPDKDGNASFEYYNADGKGSYRLVIEGIDEKGNIGRQVYRYTVQ